MIDADYQLGQGFVDRIYLLGEVISGTDERKVPDTGRPWIEIKCDLYREHAPCRAVLVVEQERIEARLARRTADDWAFETLTGAGTELVLPGFGLRCRSGALCHGTPLDPRRRP